MEVLTRIKPRTIQTKEIVNTCIQLAVGGTPSEYENQLGSFIFTNTKTPQPLRLCDPCEEDPAVPLKACAKCKQVRYCNRECQVPTG
mmetsp:Transcript_14681/g.18588  ORF Transcript_14681/g.18588 Transcript_14681/m.18588 type:complete len:87 (-) Transcript_14681:63-323(-)